MIKINLKYLILDTIYDFLIYKKNNLKNKIWLIDMTSENIRRTRSAYIFGGMKHDPE